MTPSSLAALLATHAKLATAVAATAVVTAGGGLAVASTVTADNTHAAAGLARAATHAPTLPDAATQHTAGGSADTPAADPESSDAGTTGVTCPSDVTNHGEFVASVAKTKPAEGADPSAHGTAVAAAAQSDCGKPDAAGSGDSTGAEDSTDTPDSDTDTQGDDQGEDAGGEQPDSQAPTHPTGKPETPGSASSHRPAH